jgi:four helix bundle protein
MQDHRSLEAWREARAVTLGVLGLTRSCWTPAAAALLNQLQRASLSVQLNIAEGYTFGESPTFTRHLGIAYGSAVETSELIQLAVDAGVVHAETVNVLQTQSGRSASSPGHAEATPQAQSKGGKSLV